MIQMPEYDVTVPHRFDFDKKYFDRVHEHASAIKEVYEGQQTLIFTALYGSQNYNVHHENSDVDTKSIVLPTYRRLILDSPITSTLDIDGEHAEIKDIRLMFEQYKKQNINFLETLYTPYIYINPEFDDIYQELFKHRDMITHYWPRQMIMAVCGEIQGKYMRYFQNKITEYTPKQLSNMFRLQRTIEHFLKYDNFEQALVIPNGAEADFLRRLKTDNPYTDAEMVESASEITSWANQKMYWAKNNLSLMPDYHVNEFFNELIYSTFLNHCEKR